MERPDIPAKPVDPWANVVIEPRQTTLSEWEHHLTESGYEVVDPTPVEPPIGYFKQPSMVEHIRAMIRAEELRKEAEAAGLETFEEADDFEIGDDYDPTSPYEESFDPPPVVERPPEPAGVAGAGDNPPAGNGPSAAPTPPPAAAPNPGGPLPSSPPATNG